MSLCAGVGGLELGIRLAVPLSHFLESLLLGRVRAETKQMDLFA
jgi:hypothetical protein